MTTVNMSSNRIIIAILIKGFHHESTLLAGPTLHYTKCLSVYNTAVTLLFLFSNYSCFHPTIKNYQFLCLTLYCFEIFSFTPDHNSVKSQAYPLIRCLHILLLSAMLLSLSICLTVHSYLTAVATHQFGYYNGGGGGGGHCC